ncbi:hypothetical protein [Actinopolyspora mortivallis]|uniref:hypothetical protein n=1 Tax=Actinopolyspora mortivallis TaxID=33906 RepID=UPI001C62D77F|nr:hypothetical protein [Actinopolyspora mortivallis]
MSQQRCRPRSPLVGGGRRGGPVASARVLAVTSLMTGLIVAVGTTGFVGTPLVAAQQLEPSGSLQLPTSTSSPEEPDRPSTDVSSPQEPSGTATPESSTEPAPPEEDGANTDTEESPSDSPSAERLPPAPNQPPDVRPGPGRVWTLTASTLTLEGVRYNGFALKEVDGEQVRTMHFTVDTLRIGDLVQRGGLTGDDSVRVAARPGSVSTITEGPIELYTRKLTGTLNVAGYPLVPMELSPESLLIPDLDLGFLELPKLTFTDAVVRNVELDGGKLFIPGANIAPE